HTFNHKEHREHKETADQTQIGNFSAFFVISVVKNQGTFGIPGRQYAPDWTGDRSGRLAWIAKKSA
ncbi:MAG: hypothetical protein WA077_02155, partial [Anaerolineae bacterium]